jgi:hypothetical protein
MWEKFVGWLDLPEFCGEEAREPMLGGDSGEAGLSEWCGVIGEVSGTEAGKEAEGKVEGADEEPGGKAHWPGRNAEVGDEPESSGCEGGSDAGDEGVEVGLGEAVEEEVCDDEIVGAFGREGEGVGVMSAEASGCVGSCFSTSFAQELEHGGADVDCVGAEMLVLLEELGEEAAVAIAKDQCVVAVDELWEIVIAAMFQRWTECEVFKPSIRAGYQVEVWVGGAHWWRKGRRRSGVVRARSAAARRETGLMARRWLCKRSRRAAEQAMAQGMNQGISCLSRVKAALDSMSRIVSCGRLRMARRVIE